MGNGAASNGTTATVFEQSISPSVQSIPVSKTMALSDLANSMKESGQDVVALAAGEPDFDTPAPIVEAGIAAIRYFKDDITFILDIMFHLWLSGQLMLHQALTEFELFHGDPNFYHSIDMLLVIIKLGFPACECWLLLILRISSSVWWLVSQLKHIKFWWDSSIPLLSHHLLYIGCMESFFLQGFKASRSKCHLQLKRLTLCQDKRLFYNCWGLPYQ